MDLIEFLRARLYEDEVAARACDMWSAPWSYRPNGSSQTVWSSKPGVSPVAHCEWSKQARHITRWDPARVLAEVAFKRKLLNEAGYGDSVVAKWIQRDMAQVYAEHPEFDPAWLGDAVTGSHGRIRSGRPLR